MHQISTDLLLVAPVVFVLGANHCLVFDGGREWAIATFFQELRVRFLEPVAYPHLPEGEDLEHCGILNRGSSYKITVRLFQSGVPP